jgi:alpha-L-rhamnosidase
MASFSSTGERRVDGPAAMGRKHDTLRLAVLRLLRASPGIEALLLVTCLLIAPGAAPARAGAAPDLPQCDAWPEAVIGPSTRTLRPVSGWWSDGEALPPTDLARLLDADDSSLRLSQPGPALILDFGQVVSGKIEADVADASGAPITFSSSESLAFLSPGSDTQVYGNGDVGYRPGGGRETWHAFARRTFRYVLVTLGQPGWADLDRLGLYFTAALGPPSAFKGWFQSSDAVLNSIWYAGAYTLQLVSAPGTSSAADGTLELWRGQLDVAATRESRLLLVRPGAEWTDYTFDFDLTLPPGGAGGGWAVRAAPDVFVAFRLAAPRADQPAQLQVWRGTHNGSAALVASSPLPFDLRRGRPYHVRVDAAGNQIVTSIDRHVVSTDTAMGIRGGRVGFWATAGDQFDVAHPRVFSASGAMLFDDAFDAQLSLDPARWDGAPQPLLLDGAKRDRALGLADLALAARTEYLSFGDWEWIGRLLVSTAAHQYPDGKLPGGMLGIDSVAPEDGRLPDYSLWWVLAVGDYVQQSGDVARLQELFPHVQAALAWAERRRQPDGLVPKGPGEDWYWSAQRGSGPTTALNALYAGSLLAAANLADTLHGDEVRDTYRQQASALRDAINARLWDAEAGAYVDGDLRDHHPLDGNALALLFGVADEERAGQVRAFLHDQLWTSAGTLAADRDYGAWAQDGAVWPAYVYPEVEARFGQRDDANALDLVRRTWGGMLGRDPSSTFWEFVTREGGIHDGSTSLAHGWSTGALPALSRWVLGVRPLRPGYAEYVVDPHPGDLAWACGAVPTPAGPIRIAWQQDAGSQTVWLDAPEGTSGVVLVPQGAAREVLLDGQPAQLAPISPTDVGLSGLSSGPHVIRSQDAAPAPDQDPAAPSSPSPSGRGNQGGPLRDAL